jgi:hypothetical protein
MRKFAVDLMERNTNPQNQSRLTKRRIGRTVFSWVIEGLEKTAVTAARMLNRLALNLYLIICSFLNYSFIATNLSYAEHFGMLTNMQKCTIMS